MKPLVCVRSQATCPLGIIEGVLDEQQIEWRYLDAWQDSEVPATSDIAGLIVLGGEMNVDEVDRYPFLKSVRDLTRDAIDAELPVLGICLGAQVVTRALDAPVTGAPNKEIGFVRVHATKSGMSDSVLSAFAPQSSVFQFHEDVCDLPEGAELLFRGDQVPVQAFRVGERAYGAQFHFEVTRDIIETWCDNTPDLATEWGRAKEELVAEAQELLSEQQQVGREATRRFTELLK